MHRVNRGATRAVVPYLHAKSLSFQSLWLAVLLWVVRIALLAAIILMLPSRVLEGEHWPSDGLAGLLFGGFWLLLAIQVYYWAARRWHRLLGLGEPRPEANATNQQPHRPNTALQSLPGTVHP
ncbi:MAG: phosphatase PAP2 family protein [Ktedonobacterales bacterium]